MLVSGLFQGHPLKACLSLTLQADDQIRTCYEHTMAEWLGCEAIVRQREKESHAAALAKCSSGASLDSHIQRMMHRDSTISNEVRVRGLGRVVPTQAPRWSALQGGTETRFLLALLPWPLPTSAPCNPCKLELELSYLFSFICSSRVFSSRSGHLLPCDPSFHTGWYCTDRGVLVCSLTGVLEVSQICFGSCSCSIHSSTEQLGVRDPSGGAGHRGPESQGQQGEGRGSWPRAGGQPGAQTSFVEPCVRIQTLSPVL